MIETAQDSATILLPLGAVLLASLGLEALGRRTRLPRVTLLILFGFLAGPAVLGWIPDQSARWYPLGEAISNKQITALSAPACRLSKHLCSLSRRLKVYHLVEQCIPAKPGDVPNDCPAKPGARSPSSVRSHTLHQHRQN